MKTMRRRLAALLSFVLAFTNIAPAALPLQGFFVYAAEQSEQNLSSPSNAERAPNEEDPLRDLFLGSSTGSGGGTASRASSSNAQGSSTAGSGGTGSTSQGSAKSIEQQIQEMTDEDGFLRDDYLIYDLDPGSSSDAERKEAEELVFGPAVSVSFACSAGDLPESVQVAPGTVEGSISYVSDREAFLRSMRKYTKLYSTAAGRAQGSSVSFTADEKKELEKIADQLKNITLDAELLLLADDAVLEETFKAELAADGVGVQQQIYASITDGDIVYYPAFTGTITAPKGADAELGRSYYRYVAMKQEEDVSDALEEALLQEENADHADSAAEEEALNKALTEGTFVVGTDPENRFYGILSEDAEEDLPVVIGLCLNYVTLETRLESTELKDGTRLKGAASTLVRAEGLLDSAGSPADGELQLSADHANNTAAFLVPEGTSVSVTQMLLTDQQEELEVRTAEDLEASTDGNCLTVSLPKVKLSSPKRDVVLRAAPTEGYANAHVNEYYSIIFQNNNTLIPELAKATSLNGYLNNIYYVKEENIKTVRDSFENASNIWYWSPSNAGVDYLSPDMIKDYVWKNSYPQLDYSYPQLSYPQLDWQDLSNPWLSDEFRFPKKVTDSVTGEIYIPIFCGNLYTNIGTAFDLSLEDEGAVSGSGNPWTIIKKDYSYYVFRAFAEEAESDNPFIVNVDLQIDSEKWNQPIVVKSRLDTGYEGGHLIRNICVYADSALQEDPISSEKWQAYVINRNGYYGSLSSYYANSVSKPVSTWINKNYVPEDALGNGDNVLLVPKGCYVEITHSLADGNGNQTTLSVREQKENPEILKVSEDKDKHTLTVVYGPANNDLDTITFAGEHTAVSNMTVSDSMLQIIVKDNTDLNHVSNWTNAYIGTAYLYNYGIGSDIFYTDEENEEALKSTWAELVTLVDDFGNGGEFDESRFQALYEKLNEYGYHYSEPHYVMGYDSLNFHFRVGSGQHQTVQIPKKISIGERELYPYYLGALDYSGYYWNPKPVAEYGLTAEAVNGTVEDLTTDPKAEGSFCRPVFASFDRNTDTADIILGVYDKPQEMIFNLRKGKESAPFNGRLDFSQISFDGEGENTGLPAMFYTTNPDAVRTVVQEYVAYLSDVETGKRSEDKEEEAEWINKLDALRLKNNESNERWFSTYSYYGSGWWHDFYDCHLPVSLEAGEEKAVPVLLGRLSAQWEGGNGSSLIPRAMYDLSLSGEGCEVYDLTTEDEADSLREGSRFVIAVFDGKTADTSVTMTLKPNYVQVRNVFTGNETQVLRRAENVSDTASAPNPLLGYKGTFSGSEFEDAYYTPEDDSVKSQGSIYLIPRGTSLKLTQDTVYGTYAVQEDSYQDALKTVTAPEMEEYEWGSENCQELTAGPFRPEDGNRTITLVPSTLKVGEEISVEIRDISKSLGLEDIAPGNQYLTNGSVLKVAPAFYYTNNPEAFLALLKAENPKAEDLAALVLQLSSGLTIIDESDPHQKDSYDMVERKPETRVHRYRMPAYVKAGDETYYPVFAGMLNLLPFGYTEHRADTPPVDMATYEVSGNVNSQAIIEQKPALFAMQEQGALSDARGCGVFAELVPQDKKAVVELKYSLNTQKYSMAAVRTRVDKKDRMLPTDLYVKRIVRSFKGDDPAMVWAVAAGSGINHSEDRRIDQEHPEAGYQECVNLNDLGRLFEASSVFLVEKGAVLQADQAQQLWYYNGAYYTDSQTAEIKQIWYKVEEESEKVADLDRLSPTEEGQDISWQRAETVDAVPDRGTITFFEGDRLITLTIRDSREKLTPKDANLQLLIDAPFGRTPLRYSWEIPYPSYYNGSNWNTSSYYDSYYKNSWNGKYYYGKSWGCVVYLDDKTAAKMKEDVALGRPLSDYVNSGKAEVIPLDAVEEYNPHMYQEGEFLWNLSERNQITIAVPARKLEEMRNMQKKKLMSGDPDNSEDPDSPENSEKSEPKPYYIAEFRLQEERADKTQGQYFDNNPYVEAYQQSIAQIHGQRIFSDEYYTLKVQGSTENTSQQPKMGRDHVTVMVPITTESGRAVIDVDCQMNLVSVDTLFHDIGNLDDPSRIVSDKYYGGRREVDFINEYKGEEYRVKAYEICGPGANHLYDFADRIYSPKENLVRDSLRQQLNPAIWDQLVALDILLTNRRLYLVPEGASVRATQYEGMNADPVRQTIRVKGSDPLKEVQEKKDWSRTNATAVMGPLQIQPDIHQLVFTVAYGEPQNADWKVTSLQMIGREKTGQDAEGRPTYKITLKAKFSSPVSIESFNQYFWFTASVANPDKANGGEQQKPLKAIPQAIPNGTDGVDEFLLKLYGVPENGIITVNGGYSVSTITKEEESTAGTGETGAVAKDNTIAEKQKELRPKMAMIGGNSISVLADAIGFNKSFRTDEKVDLLAANEAEGETGSVTENGEPGNNTSGFSEPEDDKQEQVQETEVVIPEEGPVYVRKQKDISGSLFDTPAVFRLNRLEVTKNWKDALTDSQVVVRLTAEIPTEGLSEEERREAEAFASTLESEYTLTFNKGKSKDQCSFAGLPDVWAYTSEEASEGRPVPRKISYMLKEMQITIGVDGKQMVAGSISTPKSKTAETDVSMYDIVWSTEPDGAEFKSNLITLGYNMALAAHLALNDKQNGVIWKFAAETYNPADPDQHWDLEEYSADSDLEMMLVSRDGEYLFFTKEGGLTLRELKKDSDGNLDLDFVGAEYLAVLADGMLRTRPYSRNELDQMKVSRKREILVNRDRVLQLKEGDNGYHLGVKPVATTYFSSASARGITAIRVYGRVLPNAAHIDGVDSGVEFNSSPYSIKVDKTLVDSSGKKLERDETFHVQVFYEDSADGTSDVYDEKRKLAPVFEKPVELAYDKKKQTWSADIPLEQLLFERTRAVTIHFDENDEIDNLEQKEDTLVSVTYDRIAARIEFGEGQATEEELSFGKGNYIYQYNVKILPYYIREVNDKGEMIKDGYLGDKTTHFTTVLDTEKSQVTLDPDKQKEYKFAFSNQTDKPEEETEKTPEKTPDNENGGSKTNTSTSETSPKGSKEEHFTPYVPEKDQPSRSSGSGSGGGGGGSITRVAKRLSPVSSGSAPEAAVLGAERTPVPQVLGAGRLPKTGEEAQKPEALWVLLLTLFSLIGAGALHTVQRNHEAS